MTTRWSKRSAPVSAFIFFVFFGRGVYIVHPVTSLKMSDWWSCMLHEADVFGYKLPPNISNSPLKWCHFLRRGPSPLTSPLRHSATLTVAWGENKTPLCFHRWTFCPISSLAVWSKKEEEEEARRWEDWAFYSPCPSFSLSDTKSWVSFSTPLISLCTCSTVFLDSVYYVLYFSSSLLSHILSTTIFFNNLLAPFFFPFPSQQSCRYE